MDMPLEEFYNSYEDDIKEKQFAEGPNSVPDGVHRSWPSAETVADGPEINFTHISMNLHQTL